ncbi:Alpha/Beta hydrolase protein [Roridomyces roridus]|uniref:Alpha/Beta hydrolase protein n=1 Tax=Roridomyces roridus TaxID=1738132 RepID=A0AAD7FI38_9AGAR|nr:Alpha/Beta hydrolase protein [Roridomyces roridus]
MADAKAKATDPSHHPRSFKYFRLLAVAKAMRFLIRRTVPLPVHDNPNVIRTDGVVPSRDQGRDIRVRWYRPVGTDTEKSLPVLIHFHGSGFVIPLFGQDDEWCLMVAERGWLVVDADYRKAPEHPFPLPCQDVEDVARHIIASVPHTTISLSGFSAGGCLALGLGVTLGPQVVRSVVTFYPSTDAKLDTSSEPPTKRRVSGTALPRFLIRHSAASYILPGTSVSLTNPLLSPAQAPVDALPRHIWTCTGTADPLYVGAETFMKRLQSEGHPDAVFKSVEGAGHGFVQIASPVKPDPRAGEVYEEAVAFLLNSIKDDMGSDM